MQTLRLIVYLNSNAKSADKRIFERMIPVVQGVKIDFDCLISSMRTLFGSSSIIVFELD